MQDLASSFTAPQQAWVGTVLPGYRAIADHAWGLVGNAVVEVLHRGDRYVVKTDPSLAHAARELDAHERWTGPWLASGQAPRLVAGDRTLGIIVTSWLPGDLVLGSETQGDPEVFRQAGALLAAFHSQHRRPDPAYEGRERDKTLTNLDKPHRIDPTTADRLRQIIRGWEAPEVEVVATHGDYQPRNWLWRDGRVGIIDFGRAALRPAVHDWLRLSSRDLARDPTLERAFVDGYGGDPRGGETWFRECLREAVNTAVWAFTVGDAGYEAEGQAMIARLLAEA